MLHRYDILIVCRHLAIHSRPPEWTMFVDAGAKPVGEVQMGEGRDASTIQCTMFEHYLNA